MINLASKAAPPTLMTRLIEQQSCEADHIWAQCRVLPLTARRASEARVNVRGVTEMVRNLALVAVMLTSLVPFADGAASELNPMQGGTFMLGEESASIYYTVDGDTFEVVTTIGAADGSSGPVRFVGFLRPGEKEIVSAGRYGTTAAPEELELTHEGSLLTIVAPANEVARQIQ
jgi:hypothetical protein